MPATLPPPLDLAPDYYLTNFRFLLSWVVERYRNIFTRDELNILTIFPDLPHASQCLLIRMATRKGVFFREDKLVYAEIPDTQAAAKALIEAGLLYADPELDIDGFVSLVSKAELIALYPDQLCAIKQQRKSLLRDELALFYSGVQPWREWTAQRVGACYGIAIQPLIDRLLLLFFGNAQQSLTDFVLQDLGLYRYESYDIDEKHRIFKSREELEHYVQLISIRDACETVQNLEQLLEFTAALPPAINSATLARRRARLCNHLAYQLERLEAFEEALELYQQHLRPPARERCVRILEKREQFADAWALIEQMLADPHNEHEWQIAQRMAPRLAKKCRKTFNKRGTPAIHDFTLTIPLEEITKPLVEELTRQYLHTEDAPCFYVENLLFNGLFGLWLWPEIFRSVDGAFANPMQMAPLDLYHEDFVKKRPNIAVLFKLLDADTYRDHCRHYFQTKKGLANHFVNWQILDETLLELALQWIPVEHLKPVFKRILFDVKANRSGFPDLIQFYPNEGRYRLIEVKGPGDRLQDNQRRWLDFFQQHNIPAEVCYVRWQ